MGSGTGPGGGLPGIWVRTRNDEGARQLAEERKRDEKRRGGKRSRDVGLVVFTVILAVWLVYRLLF